MSWQAVARKDFRDAIRSRAFWAISAIFVVLALLAAGAYGLYPDLLGGGTGATGIIFFLANVISTFVAFTAILICFKSIAGERENGSIKLLLSLPHSRREVVFGKVLGRTAVLAVPVLVALLAGTVAGALLLGSVDAVGTALLLVVALVFALTYVSAMVGFSAMTDSSTKAAVLTVGVFVVFELFWDVVLLVLVFVASGFELVAPGNFPAWAFVPAQVPPSSAFLTTLNAVVPGGVTGGIASAPTGVEAFWSSPLIGAVSLLLWLVVPVVLGTRRFQRADL